MMPATKETSHKAPRLTMAIASKVRWVRLVHLENAYWPMVVMLSGSVILIKPVQPLKAYFPMVVMLFGRVILVRLVQP